MNREELILDAAEKLFYERSFDGVGVDAIGAEAGVTGSAIYRHFRSKDEILAVLFDQASDALLRRVGEPRDDDPRAELYGLVEAHVEFAVSHLRLASIFTREQRALSSAQHRHFLRRQRRYVDRWIKCLDQVYPGHSRQDLVATVRAIHALITSDATRPPGSPVSDIKELLKKLTMAALEGLALDRSVTSNWALNPAGDDQSPAKARSASATVSEASNIG